MAFFLTCGTHTFTNKLDGYEHITVQCQNCGNFSARCYKRWEWFTICFVPLIPFSLKPWKEVGCPICRFHQDIKYRPDVQAQANQRQIPMQPQQGYGGGGGGPPPPGPPAQQPPPPQQQQQQPAYKSQASQWG